MSAATAPLSQAGVFIARYGNPDRVSANSLKRPVHVAAGVSTHSARAICTGKGPFIVGNFQVTHKNCG
jgi:hypothetical protein